MLEMMLMSLMIYLTYMMFYCGLYEPGPQTGLLSPKCLKPGLYPSKPLYPLKPLYTPKMALFTFGSRSPPRGAARRAQRKI
jgi:hypothetical protein